MSERPYLIQLEPNEDAASVRDRLSFLRGRRVLLVWPERGTVLSRKLDLVLIQREAMRRAVRLALVTQDTQVHQHAKELNISAFQTVDDSQHQRWRRGRSKVFTDRYQKPADEPNPEDLQDVASRVKNSDEVNPLRRRLARVGATLLFAGIACTLAYLLLPDATVTFTPQQTDVETRVEITADPAATDMSVEERVIPVIVLRVEVLQSGTIETTGTRTVAPVQALGTVDLTNNTLATVDVPEGTVLSTSGPSPVSFRTVEAVAVPPRDTISASVEALQDFAGEIGNVPAGQIDTLAGPLADDLTVTNPDPTFGGESRFEGIVSLQDIERLESIVRQQIQSQAYTEMLPRLTETQTVILETLAITEERDDWKTLSASVGSNADTLTLQMRAIVEATAIEEQFARTVAFASLSSQKPRQQVIEPDSVQYTLGTVSAITPSGEVRFDMQASAQTTEPVDVGQIRQQLAGRTPQSAYSLLTEQIDLQANTTPQIDISPAWVPRLPVLPARIRVQVEESTS